jgi:hypothetical protein
MYELAKLFPADVRKKIATTDWQRDGLYNKAVPVLNTCPIGLAFYEAGVSTPSQPTVSEMMTVWSRNARKLNGGIDAYLDYETWRDVRSSALLFMNRFDGGKLDNTKVARAFGYAELAQ